MPPIEPGRKAPDFTLPDQDDRPFTLSERSGRGIVLFFYPKDCTTGCTREAQEFSALAPAFRKAGAEVVGVSILGTKSKRKFAEDAGLHLRLLADDRVGKDGKPDPKVAPKYGVWAEKSMYGRTYMGLLRTTYLVGPDRTVLRRWDRVRVPDHAGAVLEAVQAEGWKPIAGGG